MAKDDTGKSGTGFGAMPGAEAMLASLASWSAAMPHAPAAQKGTALGSEHALPHAPQLVTLDASDSQPLAALASQLRYPDAQAPSSH